MPVIFGERPGRDRARCCTKQSDYQYKKELCLIRTVWGYKPVLGYVLRRYKTFQDSQELITAVHDYFRRPRHSDTFINRHKVICKYGPISQWDVHKVTSMYNLFRSKSQFNEDISSWDTSNVTNMSRMFYRTSSFNPDIGSWDTSNVRDMSNMFYEAENFNLDISDWDTSNVKNMNSMFGYAPIFNKDISDWKTSNVTDMSYMFVEAGRFNQDISDWNTSNVTNMGSMFRKAISFNQDIGNWDTSNVIVMRNMFQEAINFNQDISKWNTSKVISMSWMFGKAESFNHNISIWNTSNVNSLSVMFSGATSFNQDISDWDTSKVTNMSYMFSDATSFNQDISMLNISHVSNMSYMFYNASSFNQNLDIWKSIIEDNIIVITNFFGGKTSSLSPGNNFTGNIVYKYDSINIQFVQHSDPSTPYTETVPSINWKHDKFGEIVKELNTKNEHIVQVASKIPETNGIVYNYLEIEDISDIRWNNILIKVLPTKEDTGFTTVTKFYANNAHPSSGYQMWAMYPLPKTELDIGNSDADSYDNIDNKYEMIDIQKMYNTLKNHYTWDGSSPVDIEFGYFYRLSVDCNNDICNLFGVGSDEWAINHGLNAMGP